MDDLDFDQWLKKSRVEYIKDKTAFVIQNKNLKDADKAFLEQKIIYLEACVMGLVDAIYNIRVLNTNMSNLIVTLIESDLSKPK